MVLNITRSCSLVEIGIIVNYTIILHIILLRIFAVKKNTQLLISCVKFQFKSIVTRRIPREKKYSKQLNPK